MAHSSVTKDPCEGCTSWAIPVETRAAGRIGGKDKKAEEVPASSSSLAFKRVLLKEMCKLATHFGRWTE